MWKTLSTWGALLAVAGCAASAPETVRVASDLDNPPFAFVDPSGAPAGRDVEMMQELAAAAGLDLEWQEMPFGELLDAVEAGAVDCACATLGVTPERARRVAFTRPYFLTQIVAVTRSGAEAPEHLDELAGRIVWAEAGTTSERAVRRRLPHARLDFSQGGPGPSDRLAQREIDAAVMDRPEAERLVAASGGSLAVLPEALEEEAYALALPRSSPLVDVLDAALRDLEASGRLRELDATWGLAPAN